MELTNEDVARAISSHHFETAIPRLADDIVWTLVGEEPLRGKDAVLALLEATEAELAATSTDFERFRSIPAGDTVVIDSIAHYVDATGDASTVASCDIFEFTDGLVSEIRSYNIELPSAADARV
jgi:ketosteroid isomerase-like protein